MSSENTEQGSAGLASRMPVAVCSTCGRPEPGDGVAHRRDGRPCFYLADAVDEEEIEDDEDSVGPLGDITVTGREVPARAGQLLPEEELFQWRLRALDKALMMTISHEEFDAHEVVTLAHYALTGEPLRYPETP